MQRHDIIVVGASSGGVQALPQLISGLPADLPAAIFVVLHIAPHSMGLLPEIIRKTSALPVRHGVEGEKIVRGRVFVAPPDYHLMVDGTRVRIVHGPKENRHRPAIDALFRTAAESYGPRVIGVVLTGQLDDGTAGLNAVKTHGGIAVVQDPNNAAAPGMPKSALRNVQVDHCVPLGEMAALLVRLAKKRATTTKKKGVTKMSRRSMSPKDMERQFGLPTPFVCPECNGPLWETNSGRSLQFRCHVGHAYSPDSLLADQAESLERALWSAVRTFDEQAALLRRLAERKVGPLSIPGDLESRAKGRERDADLIRKLLQRKR